MDGSGAAALESFQVASTADLVRVLDHRWQSVPMDGAAVPAAAPRGLPRGLGELPVKRKKSAFLRAVVPLVVSVNAQVARERNQLLALVRQGAGAGPRSAEDAAAIARLARRYRVPGAEAALAAGRGPQVLAELLLRVDRVPVSLALAQAALESGWGTSRFAVEGNSLFGQWVFSSRGMDPAGRPEGARYSVARFRDLRASVAAYVRNLNTSWAYDEYRSLRAQRRAEGDGSLDALALAGGLLHYSTRRQAYVDEVRAVIRYNRLERFDAARLLPADGVLATALGEPDGLAMDERGGAAPPDA